MESEMRLRPTLAQLNSKKVQIEHLTKQMDALQAQNNDLHNEAIQHRNVSGSHLEERSILEGIGTHTKGDARLVLDEICQILSVPNSDPVSLLETIRKLEKVVKAVPRMEGFIFNLSHAMADDTHKPLPLENILPRLGIWKQIVTHSQTQLEPLIQFKLDLTQLLLGQVYDVSPQELLK